MDLLEMTVDAGCAAGTPYQFTALDASGTRVTVKMVMPLGGNESGLYRSPKAGEKVLVAYTSGTIYYLMGYLPGGDGGNPFYAKDYSYDKDGTTKNNNDVASDGGENSNAAKGFTSAQLNPLNIGGFIADSGMSLRYPKTGDALTGVNDRKYNDPAGTSVAADATRKYSSTDQGLPYSEIGFYNKQSKFPLVNYSLKNKENENEKATYYPHIDVLNIQSTGDIESRAGNYHLVKAKRLEILAGDAAHEISPKTRADTAGDNSGWNSDDVPIGDAPLEDPEVRGGDLHIRAEGKVIIKALKEIRLQVGRTTVVIDDSGFKVTSQKLNSAVALPSDTTLSLNPRTGISMFGQEVNISSGNKFSLSEAWGAKVEGVVGSLSMGGLQISQSALDAAGLNTLAVVNTMELVQSIINGGLALSDTYRRSAVQIANISNVILNTGKIVTKAFMAIRGITKNYKNLEEAAERTQAAPDANSNPAGDALAAASKMVGLEPIEQLIAGLKLVLSITAAVYNAVDTAYGAVFKSGKIDSLTKGGSNPWGAEEKSDFRDKLNLIALSIDAGIIDIVVAAYAIVGAGLAGAKISLNAGGNVILKAGTDKKLYAEVSENAAVPAQLTVEKMTAVARFAAITAEVVNDAAKITKEGLTDFQILYPVIEKL